MLNNAGIPRAELQSSNDESEDESTSAAVSPTVTSKESPLKNLSETFFGCINADFVQRKCDTFPARKKLENVGRERARDSITSI